MESNLLREDLISKLVSNLPALRAKMKISQAELANAVGIGRQTLISIESGNGKMRWDTFLAMMLIISKDSDASELMTLLGLDFKDLNSIIEDSVAVRKGNSSPLQDKLWTDESYNGDTTIRCIVPLPIGLHNSKCPKCGGNNLRGALITLCADEDDPNILCLDCGYWRD